MPDSPTLAVVIPVFNEQENLIPLLRDWLPVFKATGATFRVIFIDDGSTDQGPSRLRRIREEEDSIEVITQVNAGHGPAILRGYCQALDAELEFGLSGITSCFFDHLGGHRFCIGERGLAQENSFNHVIARPFLRARVDRGGIFARHCFGKAQAKRADLLAD